MIIDAHIHLWKTIHGAIGNCTPVKPLKNGQIQIGSQTYIGMPPTHLDCSSHAELFLAEAAAAGVDAAVVVQEPMDGPQNEYLLTVVSQYPASFFAHALPNFFSPQTVAAESFSLFARGFKGLKLPANHLAKSNVNIPLDLPEFFPIYARMEVEKKILAIDLAEGQSQIPAMQNILARHPHLTITLGHFGMPTRNGWPAQLHLAKHQNVYLETGGIVWLYRHEGYPFPGAIAAIRRAIDEIGPHKILWGSDWPRTMVDFTYRQSLSFLRDSPLLSVEEKSLLLGNNAARLYSLPKPPSPRTPIPLITEG